MNFGLTNQIKLEWEGWGLLGARNIWEFPAGGDREKSRIG